MANGLLDLIGSDLTPASDHWTRGWDLDPRECAVTLSLADADCIGTIGPDIIGGPDAADRFPEPVRIGVALGVVARLTRPVSCARPDDARWLAEKMASRTVQERIAGALLLDAVAASDAPEVVVIGSDVAGAVRRARTQWVRTVAGAEPVLHVNLLTMCALVRSGDLKWENGEMVSGIGDRVIRSDGYDMGDEVGPTVLAFYTSETVFVRLDRADVSTINDARANVVLQISDGLGSAGIAPCAVVKVVAA